MTRAESARFSQENLNDTLDLQASTLQEDNCFGNYPGVPLSLNVSSLCIHGTTLIRLILVQRQMFDLSGRFTSHKVNTSMSEVILFHKYFIPLVLMRYFMSSTWIIVHRK